MSKAANTECVIDALTNEFSVHEGDFVKLELTEFQGSKVAFILYGIPILSFLLGMLIAPYICSFLGTSTTDLARLVCAFLGLFLSLLAIAIYSKKSHKENFLMSITQIIKE